MKKILIIFCVMFFCIGLTSCKEVTKTYCDEEIKCTISVDKTKVRVGDTINIKATVENVSGEDMKIKLVAPYLTDLISILKIGTFKEGEEHSYHVLLVDGPCKELIFKKDEVITREETFKIEELINYEVEAFVGFYRGENLDQVKGVHTDIIKITVRK